MGLVQLFCTDGREFGYGPCLSTADGLQDNFFISQSSCSREGELFFGGNKGYNSFLPASLEKDNEAVPYLITDIKIFNRSFCGIGTGGQRTDFFCHAFVYAEV